MAFKRPGSQAKGAFGVTFKPPPGRTRGAEGEPSTSGRPPMRPDAAEDHPAKRARAALPVASYKRQILYAVEAHATVVLVGETGSGKTTQASVVATWRLAEYMFVLSCCCSLQRSTRRTCPTPAQHVTETVTPIQWQ